MSLRTSANRYAKALFDVVLEEKTDPAQVGRDLDAVVAMLKGSPDLAEAANRSGVTDADRLAIVEKIGAAMGLTQPVKKLLLDLATPGLFG